MITVKSLSYSTVNQYINCSQRVFFEKIERIPKRQGMTLKQLFGVALHSAIAAYFRGIMNKITLDLDTLCRVFKVRYDVWPSKDFPKREKSNDVIFAEAKILLEKFLAMNLPKNIVAVERPFKYVLTSSLTVVCQLDLLVRDEDGYLNIIDLKSSSKSYAPDQIRKVTEQTLIYSLGFHEPVRAKAWLFLRKKKPTIQEILLDLDSIDPCEIIEKFSGVAKGISSNIFFRNRGWYCSGCPYAYMCCSTKTINVEREYKEAA